jgi:hypothetical protein
LRNLEKFMSHAKMDPDEIVELAKKDPDKMDDILTNWYREVLPKQGYAASAMGVSYGSLQSFLKKTARVTFERPRMAGATGIPKSYEDRDFVLTPQQVTGMIRVYDDDPLRKAITGFSSQIAQRRSVVAYLKVKQMRPLWSITEGPIIVFVPSDLARPDGVVVNKARVDYRFGFYQDAATLLRNVVGITPPPVEEDDKPFWRNPTVTHHYVTETINMAARRSGIQTVIKTKMGQRKGRVHHHLFRSYFESRMRLAASEIGDPMVGDDVFLDYVQGHSPRYEGTYARFTPEYMTALYRKAEKYLRLSI